MTHRLYYASRDVGSGSVLETWSVYSEEYATADDDHPIENTTRRLTRHPSEAEADAEAIRLAEIRQHIERAQALAAAVDARFDKDGQSKAMWVGTPVGLTLAQVHLQLADMKMRSQ